MKKVVRADCGYKLTKPQIDLLRRMSCKVGYSTYVAGAQISSAKILERLGLVVKTGQSYVTGTWWELTSRGTKLVEREQIAED